MSKANSRCSHSIQAVMLSSGGKMAPLQSGQSLPQPKPESVTRTTAPKTMRPNVNKAVDSDRIGNALLLFASDIGELLSKNSHDLGQGKRDATPGADSDDNQTGQAKHGGTILLVDPDRRKGTMPSASLVCGFYPIDLIHNAHSTAARACVRFSLQGDRIETGPHGTLETL